MKFAPQKCKFRQSKVKYVGHIVSAAGIETDPAKVDKVINWPTPTNKSELHSFLGFAGYYRRFIKYYSKLAKPLYDLLGNQCNKKKHKGGKKVSSHTGPLNWCTYLNEIFQRLKHTLVNPPILGYPDYSKPFKLHTDASTMGISAILYQKENGKNKVISYASRSLNKSESRYSAYKLEFLALKWAVTERYHDYLYGNTCTVLTDNNPLTYVLTSAKLDTTGHRWLAALANYDLKIKYRPGSSNQAADALSRLPGLDMPQNKTICQSQSQHAHTDDEYSEMSSNVIQAVCHMFDTDSYVQSLCQHRSYRK